MPKSKPHRQLRQTSITDAFGGASISKTDSNTSAASFEEAASPTSESDSARGATAYASSPAHRGTSEDEEEEKEARRLSEAAMEDDGPSWRGDPIEALRSIYAQADAPLQPSSSHSILFRPHLDPSRPPRPFPDAYQDVWDTQHVRMPCSASFLRNGHRRWDAIESTLRKPIKSSLELEEAINSFNSQNWKFETLHALLQEEMAAAESDAFFSSLLPGIVKLALNLPHLLTGPVPLLTAERSHAVTLSQLQVASVLAGFFFCLFPARSGRDSPFPSVNFHTLFFGPPSGRKFGKLRCLLNYFRRVLAEPPVGAITFARRSLQPSELPNWSRSSDGVPDLLHVCSRGTIEDDGEAMLQMDFANKRVGGGVLNRGCVQEEIRFVICPELLVSRLLTETLGDLEALVVIGVERFSLHSGYSDSFSFAGDFVDSTPRDSWGRRRTCVLALDATRFSQRSDQFAPAALKRELDKAYTGFSFPEMPRSVATGNWGCGAFRGNLQLKFLLQLMACALAKRDMCYFTYNDPELRDEIFEMYQLLRKKSVTVKDIWQQICRYWKVARDAKWKVNSTLFEFLTDVIEGSFGSQNDE